jgi:repressor LexA
MYTLTSRQYQILSYCADFFNAKKFPPTYREIGRGIGIKSTSVIKHELETLEGYGLVRLLPKLRRCVTLIWRNLAEYGLISASYLPIVGVMGAGTRIDSSNPSWQPIDYLPSFEALLNNRTEVRAFRVEGNSMIDAGVFDQDIILLELTDQFKDGDITAVWIKGEDAMTLKRCFHGVGNIRLVPANLETSFRVKVYPEEQVEIQGRLAGVIRLHL